MCSHITSWNVLGFDRFGELYHLLCYDPPSYALAIPYTIYTQVEFRSCCTHSPPNEAYIHYSLPSCILLFFLQWKSNLVCHIKLA